jgi:hypothetical protein
MTPVRRALGLIAAVWLSCQVGLLVASPVMLWAGAAAELLECTCDHGDHALCPMHHKPSPDSTICLMRSADDNGAAVLASVYTFVGVLTPPPQALIRPSESSVVQTTTTASSCRSAPPDPPPPRA